MGLAILCIMINHARFFGLCDYGFLNDIVKIGSFGVEIFLFVSSFGLYYAYSKNSDLVRFYYRRFIRILPAFIIIVVTAQLFRETSEVCNWRFWQKELLENWFISFILLMYVLFPVLYWIQKKSLYLPLVLTVIVSLLLSCYFILRGSGDITAVPMLMSQRLPIFALGMMLADERFKINLHWGGQLLVLFTLLTLLVIHYDISYFKYPLLFFLAPLFCLWISNYVFLERFISHVGIVSLEMYLIHMKLMPLSVEHRYIGFIWVLLVLVVTFILSLMLHYVIDVMRSSMENKIHS